MYGSKLRLTKIACSGRPLTSGGNVRVTDYHCCVLQIYLDVKDVVEVATRKKVTRLLLDRCLVLRAQKWLYGLIGLAQLPAGTENIPRMIF